MRDKKTYSAKKIFTGAEWLSDHAIIACNGIVQDIIPATSSPEYDTILPAFIDLQIYGAYGKLFSVHPKPETLSLIHQYCKQGGAYWFQPTVATNTPEVFHSCIDAVKAYWKNGGEGCLGLHLEGPWINPEKRGAHIQQLVHAPTLPEVEEMLGYGKGVISMITLAPETCSNEVIQAILENNVVISAGHSNATFQQANEGFSKGISTVTHLYNAMSGLHHRQPGLTGAAMLHKNVMAGIIADGHHVDYAAVTIAKEIMKDRLFLITDAVTTTPEGPYPHQLEGDKYVASGILSGSALTMMQAVRNMIDHVGVEKTEAIKMACTYPAQAIRKDREIGRIIKGSRANFISTNKLLCNLDNLPG